MQSFYIITSIITLLASIFVIPTKKLSKLQAVRVVVWGVLSSVWFLIFPTVLIAQMNTIETSTGFVSSFHIISAIASLLPVIVAFVGLFLKSEKVKNYSFGVSIFLLIAINAALLYTSIFNFSKFATFTAPYLAINFPLMLALSLFLTPCKKRDKIILLVCYGLYALLGITALALLIQSAKDYITLDAPLLIISAIIIGVPATVITTTIIEK